jgi:hypothetical protein
MWADLPGSGLVGVLDRLLMRSADGTVWEMTVDDTGVWAGTSVLLTEAGDPLLTEAGNPLLVEV